MAWTTENKPKRVAVLCVHGIGEQKPGSTLRQVGAPLVELVRDAVSARRGSFAIVGVTTVASKSPMSVTASVTAPTGEAMQLRIYESCWASAFRPASFGEMSSWLPATGAKVLVAMGGAALSGLKASDRWLVGADTGVKDAIASVADRLKMGALVRRVFYGISNLLVTYIQRVVRFARIGVYLASVLATVALFLLLLLVPVVVAALLVGALWKATKSTTVSIRSSLAASVGDAFTFQRKIIDRAAMVDQVRTDLASVRSKNDVIIVIAHSLGSAIAYEALQDATARKNVALVVPRGSSSVYSGYALKGSR